MKTDGRLQAQLAVGEVLGWSLDQVRTLSTFEFNCWIEWIKLKNPKPKHGKR